MGGLEDGVVCPVGVCLDSISNGINNVCMGSDGFRCHGRKSNNREL